MSDDAKKIVLITSRNKVFVWESDRIENMSGICGNPPVNYIGNWSDIVASKDVKTVEDNKELVLDVRFAASEAHEVSATCSFVFNYENNLIVNILKIKWLNPNELTFNA